MCKDLVVISRIVGQYDGLYHLTGSGITLETNSQLEQMWWQDPLSVWVISLQSVFSDHSMDR